MAYEPAPNFRKRKPSDDLTDQQRLAKRFDLLNIENSNGKLYIPVSPSPNPTASAPKGAGLDDDHMSLDDTKHKVFVYDLDAELASDTESDAESKPIFIPDIEKHLNKLPKVVLIGDDAKEAAKNMQMVLYRVPESLTVSQERDSVKKAIQESRQRFRDKQALRIPDMPVLSEAMPSTRQMTNGVDGERARRYSLRSSEKANNSNALHVPAIILDNLAPKATATAYANTNYDPDIMEMD